MAHDSKTRAQWGLFLGKSLILVVCGVWLVFGYMAITHTLPVVYDYFERLEAHLAMGSAEFLAIIAGALVTLFVGIAGFALLCSYFLAKPPPQVDPTARGHTHQHPTQFRRG